MKTHQAGETNFGRFHIAFEHGQAFDRFHIFSLFDQGGAVGTFAFAGEFAGGNVHIVHLQGHVFNHAVNQRQQLLGFKRFPVKRAGFLQDIVNNLAALFKGQRFGIRWILHLVIDGRNIENIPGDLQIGAEVGRAVGVDITGVAHNLRQAGNVFPGLHQALLVADHAARIIVFQRQRHGHVHINRLFDFAGAADKHVLHIHVDADGAVPVGVISRRRAVVRRAAITGNQHEHGAQKS